MKRFRNFGKKSARACWSNQNATLEVYQTMEGRGNFSQGKCFPGLEGYYCWIISERRNFARRWSLRNCKRCRCASGTVLRSFFAAQFKHFKTRKKLHPDSALADAKRPPKCVLYTEITQGKYMREVSVIQQEWLTEISGHYYQNNMEE